jgi:hypothetical protein
VKENLATIGERLREIADQVGIEELARILEMQRTGLYVYFRGRSKPGSDLLKRLVDAGFNATWILSGIGPVRLDSDLTDASSTGSKVNDEELLSKFQEMFLSVNDQRFVELSDWLTSKTVSEKHRFISFIFLVVDLILSVSKRQRSTMLRLLQVDDIPRFENQLALEEQRAFLLMLVMDALGYNPLQMKEQVLRKK